MINKKRIAVCLFGEPRSIGTTSRFIKSFFECDDIEVDYFCHAWTKNTCRWYLEKDTIYNIELNFNEQTEEDIFGDANKVTKYLNQIYNPKKIVVEDYIKSSIGFNIEMSKKYNLDDIGDWKIFNKHAGTGQFFSTERSIKLKHQYEEENNFKYDVVYRIRYDTALEVSKWRGNFFEEDTSKKDIILQEGLLTDNIILVNAFRISDFLRPEISDHGPYIGLSEAHDKFVKHLSEFTWFYYYNLDIMNKRETKKINIDEVGYENFHQFFTQTYLYNSHTGGLKGLQFEGVWALQFVFTAMDCTTYRGIYHNLVRCGQPDWISDVRGVNNYHAYLRFKVYTYNDLYHRAGYTEWEGEKNKITKEEFEFMMNIKYDPEIDWIKDVEGYIQVIWTQRTGLVSKYRTAPDSENKLLNILKDMKGKK